MIRGYVAVVGSDLPISHVSPVTPDLCRKATIRLVPNEYTREFSINVEGTDYSFKVVGNVRTVEKRNIASGLVRIGFNLPNLDIVISCHPGDLEAFVYTVEVVKDLIIVPPPMCSDRINERRLLNCICQGPNFSQYQMYHTNDYDCPFSVLLEQLCSFCCYRVLEFYNDDDAHKILNTWKAFLKIEGRQLGIHSITVTSYPFLRSIDAFNLGLVEIPEALGSLPCLTLLNLADNQLGQATNWNWLTTPYIRENLRKLFLGSNGLSVIPEAVFGLKNLEILALNNNCLTEIPRALRNLKNLRYLDVTFNKLGILPSWMYRKERFSTLYTMGNDLDLAEVYNSEARLQPKDFEKIPVPSLLQTVATFVITNRLAFWEHNIPATLANYLEGAYCCRCGIVVFLNTIGRVIQCQIKARALTEYDDIYVDVSCKDDGYNYVDYVVPIAIHCCSYECYKLIEPYMIL